MEGKRDAALLEEFPVDNLKQMLVVRVDLKMNKNQLCTQCGHGTLGAFY